MRPQSLVRFFGPPDIYFGCWVNTPIRSVGHFTEVLPYLVSIRLQNSVIFERGIKIGACPSQRPV